MNRAWLGIAATAAMVFIGLSIGLRAQVPGTTAATAGKPLRLGTAHGRPRPPRRRGGGGLVVGGASLSERLERLRGRPVVVNAWASWCPPCRDELPLFSEASSRFGARVAFLGADVEDDAGSARRLLASAHLAYPSYAAGLAEVNAIAPAEGTPVTIFLAPSGEVLYERIGAYPSATDLDRDIRRYALGAAS